MINYNKNSMIHVIFIIITIYIIHLKNYVFILYKICVNI